MRRERPFFVEVGGLVLAALVLGLAGGVLMGRHVLRDAPTSVQVPPSAKAEFELIAEAWEVIERDYVYQEGVEPRRMAHSAIHGLVETLADVGHTRFLTPEMAERHRQQIEGHFEGIGAYVEMKDGRVVIVAPIDDTPADRAGLEPGDTIIGVDGEGVANLSLTDVVDRVLGPAGTRVSLTILDPDTGDTREVTLERARIDLEPVTWVHLPGTQVAYVRISVFSEGAAADLGEALADMEQAEEISGLILDLRNNLGGLLGEAVATVSHFLDSGNVLLRRDAQGETTAETVQEGRTVDIPTVVLANDGTASAAEIVTGALQDHRRAQVVGTTTFGAGTVLNEFALSDGSTLLLAVEEWLTPDGRVIWQRGLAPDIEVALPPDAEPVSHLELQDVSEGELRETGDEQLRRALEVLKGNAR